MMTRAEADELWQLVRAHARDYGDTEAFEALHRWVLDHTDWSLESATIGQVAPAGETQDNQVASVG